VTPSRSVCLCRVWIRPMGPSCKISVDGTNNAEWLIQRLTDHGFESTEPVHSSDESHSTFRCLTKNDTETDSLERLLVNWPEVSLQLSPDDTDARTGMEPVHQWDEHPAQPDNVLSDLEPFRVWLRPLGNAWKVRVEGSDPCQWLRRELVHRGLSCTDPETISGTDLLLFHCMSETAHEVNYAWRLLQALSQVQLQNEPA